MKIVNVIPLKKTPLKTDLTYFTTKNIDNGSTVMINLRNKKTLGLVVSVEEVSDTKINIKGMDFNLKKILEVKDKSVFLREYIDSAVLTSKYFASSKSTAITSLIPALFREQYDKIAKIAPTEGRGSSTQSVWKKEVRTEKLLLQESLENRISIYKTLIRENFASKKSIFIVLPTENDIEDFKNDLCKGIEQFTYTIHGGISTKKILEKFNDIVSNEHPILILGTSPFLSIPRRDIGLIILEHESSPSYKMIAKPHFDLRVFVEIFASKINARFILSDNLLRFDTIARKEIDRLVPMYPLSFRLNFNKDIIIENPRPKKDNDTGQKATKAIPFKILSRNSIKEIENSLVNNENVFVFTLRKGLATQTICVDCGEMVSCTKCSAPLVLYNYKKGKERVFVCNKCGDEKEGLSTCTHCKSWNLKPLGIGTDTVCDELKKIFPKNKIIKFDKDSVKNKKEASKIIEEFESSTGVILVGTEMTLFYLKNKVSLSIVSSLDSFWSIPNFRMSEKICQLIISIISKTKDKFIIQTKNEKDEALAAIYSRNLIHFIRKELEDRKELSYPPYKRFIKIKHIGNKLETIKVKQVIGEIFSDYNPLIFSGFSSQIKSKYVTNILIKVDIKDWSIDGVDQNLLSKLLSLPLSFDIYVDPEDLL